MLRLPGPMRASLQAVGGVIEASPVYRDTLHNVKCHGPNGLSFKRTGAMAKEKGRTEEHPLPGPSLMTKRIIAKGRSS